MEVLTGTDVCFSCTGKRSQGLTRPSNFTSREDIVSGSRRVPAGSHGSQLLSLEKRLNGCHSLDPVMVCRQQKHQRNRVEKSGSVLDRSINASRKQSGNLVWTSDVFKHATFSRSPPSGEHSRSVRMGLHSGSDGDTEAALSIKTRKNPMWGIFDNFSNVFRADELGLEIALIALPAILALAADPLASLVDTAFIGQIGIAVLQVMIRALLLFSNPTEDDRIHSQEYEEAGTSGPVELAAVGVSISVFNLVSKMFNVPLLNVTTSFVAEDASEEAFVHVPTNSEKPASNPLLPSDNGGTHASLEKEEEKKVFLPAVSSALVLGTALGAGEACVLAFFAGPVLTVMGVGLTSPMRTPAVEYLALRALGAPAVVVALAIQGIFRGFKDTKTPLYACVAGNIVNIVLDPILMFSLKFGVGGAAVATVASQYLIAGLLLWNLNKRVVLLPPRLGDMDFSRFLKSGGFLLGRTIALLLVTTLATSMAARQGAIPMAAHQICMQIWLAASLLSDSVALAGQAIIASAFAKNDYKRAKEAAFRVLQIGGGLGMFLAIVLGLGMPAFSRLFTRDPGVLAFMGLLVPFMALTQPINALAFVFDGLHYGASDFAYAAVAMMVLAVPSILVLLFLPKFWGLSAVWVGLATVMTLRMLAGFWRLGSGTGPWQFLKQEAKEMERKL